MEIRAIFEDILRTLRGIPLYSDMLSSINTEELYELFMTEVIPAQTALLAMPEDTSAEQTTAVTFPPEAPPLLTVITPRRQRQGGSWALRKLGPRPVFSSAVSGFSTPRSKL